MPDPAVPPKRRQLKVELDPLDERFTEQLAAALQRIETGLTGISDGLQAAIERASKPARLTVAGPEPEWLTQLRSRFRDAQAFGAAVVLVPRNALGMVLDLIDQERKR